MAFIKRVSSLRAFSWETTKITTQRKLTKYRKFYRLIPNFSILDRNVVGLMFNILAAPFSPLIRQSVIFRILMM